MKTRIAVFVLFCVAALAFTSGAHAQFPRGARGVTGTVSSIEGTTIRLFDNRLTLGASRAIVRSDLGPATVADIKVGDRISAYVFDWRKDAGTVTGITAASLTITFPPTDDFATFAITAETEFSGGRPSVGDDVTVFYRRDGEQNIATRVVLEITV